MSTFDDEYVLQHPFSIQATFEGWMELMDDAVDSKEVFFQIYSLIYKLLNIRIYNRKRLNMTKRVCT